MTKIVFFSIPAYGHTNPTISLVKELTDMGVKVWYYSFEEFREKIEGTNAVFISCDDYLPPTPKNLDRKVGKDFAALIEMVTHVTQAMDKSVFGQLLTLQPDCIVSDSLCFWGKLFARKLRIPYICSTTTFAFNRYSARLMKKDFGQALRMLAGIPRINKCIKQLRTCGYEITNFLSLIQNDNETDTIVYTSKEFQPMSETFSEKHHFIGPSIPKTDAITRQQNLPQLYISLGTVNNVDVDFYKSCLKAFENSEIQVIMSVGDKTHIEALGSIPENFIVKNKVNQLQVLQTADVFLSHCGMNSVNESLYYAVPLILFPQQEEQKAVAVRVEELGAGLFLKSRKAQAIRTAVTTLLHNPEYRNKALGISQSFHKAGGSKRGAQAILEILSH